MKETSTHVPVGKYGRVVYRKSQKRLAHGGAAGHLPFVFSSKIYMLNGKKTYGSNRIALCPVFSMRGMAVMMVVTMNMVMVGLLYLDLERGVPSVGKGVTEISPRVGLIHFGIGQ